MATKATVGGRTAKMTRGRTWPVPRQRGLLRALASVALACLVLTTLSIRPAAAQESSPALYEGPDRTARLIAGAKREGSLTLYGSMAERDLRGLVNEFERRYGIKEI